MIIPARPGGKSRQTGIVLGRCRWRAALSVLANASPPPPKGEARLGLLQASGGLPSPPPAGALSPAGSVKQLNGAHWAPAPPKGGGETWLCASFWQRTYLAPPSGPLRPGGTLPSGRSPLPRRSVMDAAHWVASPEAAAESAGTALAVTERARRWLAAQLPGSHLLGAPPSGKAGQSPCFPSFLLRCAPIRSRSRSSRLFEKAHQKLLRLLP